MPLGGRLLSSARALLEHNLTCQIPKYALHRAEARANTRTLYDRGRDEPAYSVGMPTPFTSADRISFIITREAEPSVEIGDH
jgi:hypothetical protein